MSLRDVLAALAAAPAVSGEALAQSLGVTRAAVWKQIERVRELGVAVDAVPGVGYRLAQPLELLDAGAIRAALSPATRRLVPQTEVAFEIDSTSSELLRRAPDDAASGTVLFAERQLAGRGRRGRAWHSPLGANLYFSLLWRFDGGLAALAGLSLAVGVALAQALAARGVADIALKWPNDLVVGDRKLGGVLIEAGGDAMGPCHAVIGIGINVRMPPLPADVIDQPWCDLAGLLPSATVSRNALAAALVDALAPALAHFARDGAGDALRVFATFDALAGARVDVHDRDGTRGGIARGVDALGRLRVEAPDGSVRAVDSGEVTVRRRRGAAA